MQVDLVHQREGQQHEPAEDEGGDLVGRQRGDEQAERDARRADKEHPEVLARHLSPVEPAQRREGERKRYREGDHDGEQPEAAQELAQHDLPLAEGQREQDLEGARPLLLGPGAHREGRHQEDEDRRDHAEVDPKRRLVAREELVQEEQPHGGEDQVGDRDDVRDRGVEGGLHLPGGDRAALS